MGRSVISRYSTKVKPWHYTVFTFFISFLVSWALICTFQFRFLFTSRDFNSGVNVAGSKGDGTIDEDNKVFSDRGRYMAALWSGVGALVITGLLHYMVFTKM